jgi:hypothetical protein
VAIDLPSSVNVPESDVTQEMYAEIDGTPTVIVAVLRQSDTCLALYVQSSNTDFAAGTVVVPSSGIICWKKTT